MTLADFREIVQIAKVNNLMHVKFHECEFTVSQKIEMPVQLKEALSKELSDDELLEDPYKGLS